MRFHLLAFLIGATAFAQAPRYTVHDLGANTTVTAINSLGQVVGCFNAGSVTHAFRTEPNAAVHPNTDDLGTLGGTTSCAAGINTIGEVVGSSTDASGNMRGFRTAANAKINAATDDLGTLGGPAIRGSVTEAYAINDLGQVVGWSSSGTGSIHAFRTEQRKPINPATDDIGSATFSPIPANAESIARSINNSGEVDGLFLGGMLEFPEAFAYQNGVVTEISSFVLAAQGSNFSGVNASGVIAGGGGVSIWQNGNLTNLASCQCQTTGLNDLFEVVGANYTSGARAFLYASGTLEDLNNLIRARSGWILINAIAINDAGQIIGTGQFNGQPHAFRLDPTGR